MAAGVNDTGFDTIEEFIAAVRANATVPVVLDSEAEAFLASVKPVDMFLKKTTTRNIIVDDGDVLQRVAEVTGQWFTKQKYFYVIEDIDYADHSFIGHLLVERVSNRYPDVEGVEVSPSAYFKKTDEDVVIVKPGTRKKSAKKASK